MTAKICCNSPIRALVSSATCNDRPPLSHIILCQICHNFIHKSINYPFNCQRSNHLLTCLHMIIESSLLKTILCRDTKVTGADRRQWSVLCSLQLCMSSRRLWSCWSLGLWCSFGARVLSCSGLFLQRVSSKCPLWENPSCKPPPNGLTPSKTSWQWDWLTSLQLCE